MVEFFDVNSCFDILSRLGESDLFSQSTEALLAHTERRMQTM